MFKDSFTQKQFMHYNVIFGLVSCILERKDITVHNEKSSNIKFSCEEEYEFHFKIFLASFCSIRSFMYATLHPKSIQ